MRRIPAGERPNGVWFCRRGDAVKRTILRTNRDPVWSPSVELTGTRFMRICERKGIALMTRQIWCRVFFVALIEKDFLDAVDPQRGRFRWFLMNAISRFAANWTQAQTRQKRGGGKAILSLDLSDGETRYSREPADQQTPEHLFERRWALTVLDQAVEQLAAAYQADGKQRYFDTLKVYLTGDSQAPAYAESAAALGVAETTVKVAVHRMRDKYRQCIRRIVSDTLDQPEDLDAEINDLLDSLG